MAEDRLTILLEQSAVTGIDFVQIVDPEDQTVLRVFFLLNPDELDDPIVNTASLPVDISADTVTIKSVSGGERLAEVPVVRTTYKQVPLNGETRTVLEIETTEPGDFSIYRLTIVDKPKDRIDRFFNGVEFSFKQGCPSLLDCRRPAPECPPEDLVDFPVDYLARDFVSFRNALLDFAAQRYPKWTEKIEADAGVMLAEVMAALGDDLSYIQDRYAREAYLETATQRRSLRFHTRLVDYNIHDGLAAGTFLDLTVKNLDAGNPDSGTLLGAGGRVWAPAQAEPAIPFEIGGGLNDQRQTLLTLLFSVGLAFQADLDAGGFSLGLRQEFANHHILFSDAPTPGVSVQEPGSRWLISHPVVSFFVAKENNSLNIFGVGRQFYVQASWNQMPIHIPDESQPCLPVGTTELFLRGTFPTAGQIPAGEDPTKFWTGKWLLLKTDPEDPSVPARRHLVRVVEVEQTTDPLFLDGNNPIAITRIKWEDQQALPFEMCQDDMVVRGNLVFATAGETITELFTIRTNDNIPEQDADRVSRAIERQGPLDDVASRRSVTFLYSLRQTETQGLGWVGNLREAAPEVELQEVNAADLEPPDPPEVWEWSRSLLDSRGFQDEFTLDNGTWRRIISFQRIGEVIEHLDYASGSGFTIRFGDGEFGRIPGDGTVFQARYRTGPGTKANLPADTIVNLTNPADEADADLGGVLDGVTNPLAVTSGVDPEDIEVIKQLAPEAFRAVTFRAVRPKDYAEIAERLPFVQRAGARFRWTGSWLSTFVTADPLGSFQLSPAQRTELANLMDCVRQAGREVFVRNPRFVNIDLEITICIEPFAYVGQVTARVLEALLGRKGVRPTKGFFHPDNFTFGTPLRRAVLEAVIQEVPGVRGVEEMRIRARGITDWRSFDELTFVVRDDQIIRLENDPRFPERGTLRIIAKGEEQT